MPEEVNRVISDHLATWRLAATPTAVKNLAQEGLVAGVSEVGDPMQDLASRVSAENRDLAALERGPCARGRAGAAWSAQARRVHLCDHSPRGEP
jgi:UDP-N-acetylglucosamine 2-epimerase